MTIVIRLPSISSQSIDQRLVECVLSATKNECTEIKKLDLLFLVVYV